jgi:CPA1 family monovalent cation:H+ antiporter
VEVAVLLLALAVAVLAFTALAGRLDFPAPLLLIAVGVVASYLPGVPEIHLEPEVVLLGLLPPLLYAAAIQTSLVDFNANRRAILLLSVGLVVFTTLGVGAIVHEVIPGISWPVSFAIGAVVAPPDAVAATAIARRIGLPRRIVTILEGESLLNDATALVALRTAIAASSVGVEAMHVGQEFLIASLGGGAIGFVVFVVVAKLRRLVTDPVLDTAISFVVPFGAFIAAEEIHASGVIAVVVAGLLLGHKAPIVQTAQSRIAERTNWRTIAFVLENTVFLLIGLQAGWILEDVSESTLSTGRIIAVCAAVLVACIVLRLAWVFPARYLLVRPGPDPATGKGPPWTYTFILGWAGMRGVVTLAAAFLIPEDTPHREVLLLIAFTVVAGTLFLQGLSLPMLARRLRVPSPDPMEDALARATLLQQASKAGFKVLQQLEYDDPQGVVKLVKQRIEQRNFAAWERLGTQADVETPSELYARVRLAMLEAERARVLEIRDAGQVASEVVSEVLAMLDVEESMIDVAQASREELKTEYSRVRRTGASCDHLDARPAQEVDQEPAPVCQQCVDEGYTWVSLRLCLDCGHIGCCDSSVMRHATGHFRESTHPVMQSAEPLEDWRWCFVHHVTA